MPWPYKRNVAQELDFPFFDADGDLVNVSGTITKQVAIDGKAFVAVSGSVTQYGTTGVYKFSGQAPDWNGARLTFLFSEPVVKPTVLTFHTDSKQFTDIPTLADLKAQAENALTAFAPIKTSVSGRLFDVSAGGEGGLDWANIGSPDTVVSLGGTTIRGSGLLISGIVSSPLPPPTTQDIWSFVGRQTGLTGVAISGVWGNSVRTLTSAGAGGATAQEVWEYATRSLTDKDNFNLAANQNTVTFSGYVSDPGKSPTPQDIWSYATGRTLTDKIGYSLLADQTTVRFSGYVSDPGKAPTSQDIWAFSTRAITDKAGFSLAADQTAVTVGAVSGAVGSVTGNVGGNVTGSVGSVAQSGISPATFGADVREQVASAVIKRGMVKDETALENRSLGWAIAKLVNKLDVSSDGATLTTRRTNDSTALFTQAITTSGGAAPITAVDTA